MAAKLRVVGEGLVHGVLYDLGEYPGAVLDAAANSKIAGTVLELPADTGILSALDEYEGYDSKAPETSLFVRVTHRMTMDSGGELACWIYVYNRDPKGARIAEDGRSA